MLVSQSRAMIASLFLVLVFIVLVFLPPPPPQGSFFDALRFTYYAVAIVHISASLYDGVFSRLRTVTWTLFWLALSMQVLFAFSAWIGIDALLERFGAFGEVLLAFAAPSLLLADVVAAQASHVRLWSWRALGSILACAILAAILLDMLAASFITLQVEALPEEASLPAIIPPWYLLPFYSVLRSVPDKLGGVVAVFAVVLLPIIWPWVRADLIRTSRFKWLWAALCLLLPIAWVALGYLATLEWEDSIIAVSQLFSAYIFAFFIIIPFTLRRLI